jgi:hypothetical protein
MTRFEFSISSADEQHRLAGSVTSGTLSDALQVISDRAATSVGDRLEIGVSGFPPARFLYVPSVDGDELIWQAEGRKAA